MQILTHLHHVMQGKHPISSRRSSHWPTVRRQHLAKFPACAVCGGTKKVQVHHKKPFHLFPELELDPDNLITLCEGKKAFNCHLLFGHLGNFKQLNPTVADDSSTWKGKLLAAKAALKRLIKPAEDANQATEETLP